MRNLPRLLAFAICVLLAFWFTAENADEIVRIDLAFLRIRASLPLVVFGSVLLGMIATLIVGWRADRRTRELLESERRRRAVFDARGFGETPAGAELGVPEELLPAEEERGEPVA